MERKPARYLLRLDDLCPTALWPKWNPLLALLEELDIRPILAVIPQNEDRELELAPPDAAFWPRLRALAARGATIGLHGYRHVCASRGRSLVPLHRWTEFAGAPFHTQRAWIHAGAEILRQQGVAPRIWVAPRHGFDRRTLAALEQEGIELLSDGFAPAPFTRGGLTWLPQQLWEPVEKASGLWTICAHPNTAADEQMERLCGFLRAHRTQFISAGEALQQFPAKPFGLSAWWSGQRAVLRIRATRMRKRLWR